MADDVVADACAENRESYLAASAGPTSGVCGGTGAPVPVVSVTSLVLMRRKGPLWAVPDDTPPMRPHLPDR